MIFNSSSSSSVVKVSSSFPSLEKQQNRRCKQAIRRAHALLLQRHAKRPTTQRPQHPPPHTNKLLHVRPGATTTTSTTALLPPDRNKKQGENHNNDKINLDGSTKTSSALTELFIGNLPIHETKRTVIKHLQLTNKDIHSLRFRSLPLHPKWANNRKLGVLATRGYSEVKAVKNCYVVLQSTVDDAKLRNLLRKNGSKMASGHLLRVDLATDKFSKFDRKRTVFVGNVHLSVSEKELAEAFASKTEVTSVRIVRDSVTSLSKGFGFVMFKERSDVPTALKEMNEQELKGRPLRVSRALAEEEAKAEEEQKEEQRDRQLAKVKKRKEKEGKRKLTKMLKKNVRKTSFPRPKGGFEKNT